MPLGAVSAYGLTDGGVAALLIPAKSATGIDRRDDDPNEQLWGEFA